MIELTDIHFTYPDGPKVLVDLSLQAQPNEILGILGPNGAGKTTLLHLMAGLLTPEQGEVLLDGKSLRYSSRTEIARQISLVPQKDNITLPFSTWDVVLMGRQPYQGFFGFDGERDQRIAQAALKATGTEEMKFRSIQSLSGGERRRVLIARALAQDTPLLLLDEPIAHLDIHYQLEICELLLKLREEKGHAIVITLHDINLAALYCDRVLFLADQKIYRAGRSEDIITEQSIADVFGVNVKVRTDEETGRPYYRLLRKQL